MMLVLVRVVLFAFLPVSASGHDAPFLSLQTQIQPPWIIQFQPQDSALARDMPRLLDAKLPDIQRDLAMQAAGPYVIVVAPSREYYNHYLISGLPKWSGAYAVPTMRTLVMKSPRWDRPENDFGKTLIHEMVHLLLHERIKGQPAPRWLDEGLALFYEEPRDWDFPLALSKALLTRSLIPLGQIDAVLSFHPSQAALAYQESYSVVTYFLSLYDLDGLQILLDGLQRRESLEAIFVQATGSPFSAFELEWQQYIQDRYSYHWLAEWDTFLWLFILLLAAAAFLWIRRRNQRTVQEWEAPLEASPSASDATPEESGPRSATGETFIENNDPDA
ncbi:MAG TPA: peptidase MA family metallohydrolase [bacterium]|nr:peptidase MA family metallohydrolase [bacterium]HPN33788.1 peptidase MA family metallohydrolase [bacterium]